MTPEERARDTVMSEPLPDLLLETAVCRLAAEDGEFAWNVHLRLRDMLRAIEYTLPPMEKYEGQGEGGIAEFNIAMEALRRARA